jgi:hypothetical protein
MLASSEAKPRCERAETLSSLVNPRQTEYVGAMDIWEGANTVREP